VSTSYQGPSTCCAGVNQIVFKVPAGVTGCSVPVEVSINNVVSPTTTMPIGSDSSRVCSDPNGIPSSILQALLSKPSFNLGTVSLSRTTATLLNTSTDTGSAVFFNIKPLEFAGATSFQKAAIGSCIVNSISESAETTVFSGFTGLDAGPFIDVNGPGGTQELAPLAGITGVYASTNGTTPFLTPGAYTASGTGGTGGAAVGPFSVDMTVANPITWTNEASIGTVDRASGVTVTWTGGAPGTYATISGTSFLIGSSLLITTFTCQAPIAQGTFTVGPDVLLQLPASTSVAGIGLATLSVGNNEPYVEFTATGLDYGFAQSSVSISASVTYQ
jgi:hypothetical protein